MQSYFIAKLLDLDDGAAEALGHTAKLLAHGHPFKNNFGLLCMHARALSANERDDEALAFLGPKIERNKSLWKNSYAHSIYSDILVKKGDIKAAADHMETMTQPNMPLCRDGYSIRRARELLERLKEDGGGGVTDMKSQRPTRPYSNKAGKNHHP